MACKYVKNDPTSNF
uniref:Uncharacterized protein n=1 Tax=Rhizophora mucronata TaxID=61149 RepID=A0A2P2N5T6_RHIMU